MDITPALDIVIPAYKCSHTIKQTLQSLDLQFNTSFNVIVVLDGEDAELAATAIACAPTTIQGTFRIVTRAVNGGPGACRNTGIKESIAPYIMFLDADDLLLPNAVGTIYNGIEKGFDYMIGKTMRQSQNGNFEVVGSEQLTWIHGRVYRKSFLQDNGISFPELPMSEDLAFNMLCAEYAQTVPETAWPIHIQRWREGSISHSAGAERLQALTYIQAALFYAQHITPQHSRLLPNVIANCYYYLDGAERMFPGDTKLYSQMCADFVSLADAVDLLCLLSSSWVDSLAVALTSPGRPFKKILLPEMSFCERVLDAISIDE